MLKTALLILFGVISCVLTIPRSKSPFRVISGEYRSLRKVGDQLEAEYEQFHPDGSVTKSVAFGDKKNGFKVQHFQMDRDGNLQIFGNSDPFKSLNDDGPRELWGRRGQSEVADWTGRRPREQRDRSAMDRGQDAGPWYIPDPTSRRTAYRPPDKVQAKPVDSFFDRFFENLFNW